MVAKLAPTTFVFGALGIGIYILCVVIPYELYVSGAPAASLHPGPAPGYLSWGPLSLIAYWLTTDYSIAYAWVIACSLAAVWGRPPRIIHEKVRLLSVSTVIIFAIIAASYVRLVRDTLGSILE
jgi:hypothetical protein